MKIVFFDTSTDILQIALIDNDVVKDYFQKNAKRIQTEIAVFELKKFFERNKLKFEKIDAFLIMSYPGSYTGLRVAYSATEAISAIYPKIKTLTFAKGIKIFNKQDLEINFKNIRAFEKISYGDKFDEN